MRPESHPFLFAGALALALAGCAGTGGGTPRALKAQPEMSNKGMANLQLAQNYLASGKLDVAMDRAQRAMRSDPGSADVQVVMGMIRQALDDQSRAGEHFAQAAKLAPDTGHVLNAYGAWLCERQQYDEADEVFSRAVADPFYEAKAQAYFNAGRCSMLGGRLDRAEPALRKGLDIDPDGAALLEQMARLQYQQRNFLGARAFFQRREAVGEVGAELLELAIAIEEGAGDRAAAERYRTRLRQGYPDHTPTAREEAPQS
ncbi:type IV pilus biogenesis/stability protein PilW [Arenimonas sp.]|uniref:type IV pilus biogenesis/stability protein PilW n=1 Tax=Arenimonas sp. TaxID=1872635 RepID=UPI0035AF5E2D